MSTKVCSHCQEELSVDQFHSERKAVKGHTQYDHRCRKCKNLHAKQLAEAKKKAGPKPANNECECCHKISSSLVVDHVRGTTNPRGWLCRSCNTGMGLLGDNLEGVMNAVKYLSRETTN